MGPRSVPDQAGSTSRYRSSAMPLCLTSALLAWTLALVGAAFGELPVALAILWGIWCAAGTVCGILFLPRQITVSRAGLTIERRWRSRFIPGDEIAEVQQPFFAMGLRIVTSEGSRMQVVGPIEDEVRLVNEVAASWPHIEVRRTIM
jgi:hypothetical protein